jgi:acid phosphatase type 7
MPPPPPPNMPPPPPPPPPPSEVTLIAVGDIASCSSSGDEATGALVDGMPGTIALLGDLAYNSGTLTQFQTCFEPSWGRHKPRSWPSPGNHEYETANAAAYFTYFGAAAGDPTKGYYSYDLGDWHIVVLNSNIDRTIDSEQVRWLREDLTASARTCTLAYWHHPRFNSGSDHGNNRSVAPFWTTLHELGADVVLNGHEHVYERFAPQTPAAAPDPERGIRQFTVGTGGRSHDAFKAVPEPNSEVRNASTYGVLKLSLKAGGYDWQFVPVPDATFTDSGSGTCH